MSYIPSISEIQEFRTKLGIKQNELAKATGVTTNMISQIETNRARPNAENFKSIIEYFYKKSDEHETKLESIMAMPVKFIRPSQSALDAKKAFDSFPDIDLLPVMTAKDGSLLGKITRISLVNILKESNKDAQEIIINDILEESPPTIPYDTPKTWIRAFLQIRNNCVLVTKNGKIVGIVNYWDYLSKI